MLKITLTLLTIIVCNVVVAQNTFTNPLKESGPDPWVIYKDGYYYYMNTTGSNLQLWKTKNVTELKNAEHKIIYTPPATGMYSKQLWAPEIHFLRGKWYVYYAADDGNNINHRMYVLENASPDPMQGEWVFKGKLADPGDHWAIDMTVAEINGKIYAAWSGWEGKENGVQRIYIAELSNPWTMKGDRVEISHPFYEWEKKGAVPEEWQKNGEVPYIMVNEGPEFLIKGDNIFLIYSANACWLDYCLGMLQAKKTSNILDPSSWKKHPKPVFVQAPENGVYAPGHNSFFKSPDGKEDWILYHANPSANDGCGNKRAPHAQKFTWKKDGTPDFGKPLPKVPMKGPSN